MIESHIPDIIIKHRHHKSPFTLSLVLEGMFLNGRNEEINTTRLLLHTLIPAALRAPIWWVIADFCHPDSKLEYSQEDQSSPFQYYLELSTRSSLIFSSKNFKDIPIWEIYETISHICNYMGKKINERFFFLSPPSFPLSPSLSPRGTA